MKRFKLLLSAVLSFSSVCLCAQFNNIYLGPEGGPGVTFLWGNSQILQDRVPIVAGTAGYAFQYNFTKIFSIRTDLAYERAGTDYLNYTSFTNYPITRRSEFNYLTLPILARATFGKKVGFFINAGPYISVLLREVDIAEDALSNKIIEYHTGYYKRPDIGISEGLGVLVPFGGSFAVSFEARNNTGFYNISNPAVYGSANGAIRNNTTNFIFAFIYKLVTKKPAAKQKPVKA